MPEKPLQELLRNDALSTTRYSLALRSNRYHEDVCPRKSNKIPQYGDAQIRLMKVLQPETFEVDSIFKGIRQYEPIMETTPIATAPPQPRQAGKAPLPTPPPPRLKLQGGQELTTH